MSKLKALMGTIGATALVASVNTHAAVSSVLPADLATDQATIAGDIAGAGAVVIALGLTAMGVRKVVGMF